MSVNHVVEASININTKRVTLKAEPPLPSGLTFRVSAGDVITWTLHDAGGVSARVVFLAPTNGEALFKPRDTFEADGNKITSDPVNSGAKPLNDLDTGEAYLYRFEVRGPTGIFTPFTCVTADGAEALTCGGEKGGAPRVAGA